MKTINKLIKAYHGISNSKIKKDAISNLIVILRKYHEHLIENEFELKFIITELKKDLHKKSLILGSDFENIIIEDLYTNKAIHVNTIDSTVTSGSICKILMKLTLANKSLSNNKFVLSFILKTIDGELIIKIPGKDYRQMQDVGNGSSSSSISIQHDKPTHAEITHVN